MVYDVEVAALHGNDGDDNLTSGETLFYPASEATSEATQGAFDDFVDGPNGAHFWGNWGILWMYPGRTDITAFGHDGNDIAQFQEDVQSFTGSPEQASVDHLSFTHTAFGFEEVYVTCPWRNSAQVELRGSAENDTFC